MTKDLEGLSRVHCEVNCRHLFASPLICMSVRRNFRPDRTTGTTNPYRLGKDLEG